MVPGTSYLSISPVAFLRTRLLPAQEPAGEAFELHDELLAPERPPRPLGQAQRLLGRRFIRLPDELLPVIRPLQQRLHLLTPVPPLRQMIRPSQPERLLRRRGLRHAGNEHSG